MTPDQPAVTASDFEALVEEALARWAAETWRPLEPGAVAALARYAGLLLDENRRVNLTGARSPEDLVRKHLADALPVARRIELTSAPVGRLVDIGSGGGLPGIPLAILLPQLDLSLVESVGKKARFLAAAVQSLGLGHVEVLATRAEELGRRPEARESYGLATLRACASLAVCAEYALPLLAVGGSLLAPKGSGALEEAEAARPALEAMGGLLEAVEEYRLPGVDARFHLVVVKKLRATPRKYPRASAVICKRPPHRKER